MNARQLSLTIAVALLLLGTPLVACLWDRDTLEQERQRFPSALELITGHFLRHSTPFYEWRVEDRLAKLARNPEDLALYDDLAVAYEKLGKHDEAIEVIQRKDARSPGLYETHANLGTFYIHAGRLREGLDHIERAIEINPEAHFGREVYQKLLVEYVLGRQVDGVTPLPIDSAARGDFQPGGFAGYVLDAKRVDREDKKAVEAELQRALKGVLGMMRFGNHDSPVLLEAAGDLLLANGYPADGKRLAVRAFLKASYETEGDAQQAYRELAQEAVRMQTVNARSDAQLKLSALEHEFKKELKSAQRWYRGLEAKERRWIQRGVDPEAAFLREYTKDPKVGASIPVPSKPGASKGLLWQFGLVLLLPIAVVIGWLTFRARRVSVTAQPR